MEGGPNVGRPFVDTNAPIAAKERSNDIED